MEHSFLKELNLKKMILVISIIIVCIFVIILTILLLGKEKDMKEEKKIMDQGDFKYFDYEKNIVTDHSTFFSVADNIQKYLSAISINVENISSIPVEGSTMRSADTIYAENQNITDEKSKKEAVYSFLDKNYIQKYNITPDNVLDKIQEKDVVTFYPLKMYELPGDIITQYAVYGKTKKVQNGDENNAYYILNVDKKNNTFSIVPIRKNEYEDVDDIPLVEKKESIEVNNNNTYSYRIMQDNEVVQKYFTYYKEIMLNNKQLAYELLDDEYKNKRFSNIEEFSDYVDNNREDIQKYLAQEYELNHTENGTEYVCRDQYHHDYIFNVTAAMQFTVKLDNYTIESEGTRQKYQQANDKRKVEMNVDKWILMLNNRDYKAAYDVLDEKFKSNYFKTVEDFEEYMRSKFTIYYGLTFSDFSQQAGVYIQDIILTDIRAKEDMIIPETIIMKLTDNGFKMSFRVLN